MRIRGGGGKRKEEGRGGGLSFASIGGVDFGLVFLEDGFAVDFLRAGDEALVFSPD